MKNKINVSKRILALVLAITLLFGGTVSVSAAEEYTSGNFTYTVADGKAKITSYPETASGAVEIPSKLGGYPVTAIDVHAFSGCTFITEVTVPNTVKTIGDYAFAYCTTLTNVKIPSSVTSIGKNAFAYSNNIVVECKKGSYAEKYAKDNGLSTKTTDSSDVITGLLKNVSASSWSDGCTYEYVYKDSFFENDSSVYSHEFATMTLALACAACVPDGGWKENSVGKWVKSGDDFRFKYAANAAEMFDNIGFDLVKSSVITEAGSKTVCGEYYGYNVQPQFNTIAFSLGAKNLDESNTTIIACAVRGGGYESEWGGNFVVGSTGTNHKGFDDAKKQVLTGLNSFVSTNKEKFNDNIKIWITGYSRAGATANLTAAELNRGAASYSALASLKLTKDNIYCYGFETPQGTTDKNAQTSSYDNIFSIVNPIDPVPLVAPSSSGFNFKRYGVTYYLPAKETVSNYKRSDGKGIMNEMSTNFKNIYRKTYDETFMFYQLDSDFSIDISFSGISTSGDLLKLVENTSIGQMTFIRNLVDYVATGALKNRKNYHENYEDTLKVLIAMFLGGYGGSDKDELMDAVIGAVKTYFDNAEYVSFSPIENLKERLAEAISNNSDISYSEAYSTLSEIDEVLKTAISHPNYCITTYKNANQLFYPHYGEVTISWMTYLNNCSESKRNILLRKNCKYREYKINCPVDVKVYNDEGDLVGAIIDDVVQNIDGLSVYIDNNGQKCIAVPFDSEYTFEIIATDKGSVNCSISEYNAESLEADRVVNYFDMTVEKGDVLTATAENLEDVEKCEYPILDDKGKEILPDEDVESDEIESFTVTAESDCDSCSVIGGGEFVKGEFAKVVAIPAVAGTFSGWYNGDECVSESLDYRFMVTENCALEAKFAPKEIIGLTLSASVFKMNYKSTQKLDAGDAKNIVWSSSDESVAVVDSEGNVTAVGTGTATITATIEGTDISDTCEVKVSYAWWQWIIRILLLGFIWY